MAGCYTYEDALVATYGTNMAALSTGQKVAVFQAIEDRMAYEQGREPGVVVAERMPWRTRGYYEHGRGTIALNEELMDHSPDGGAYLVATVIHEGRHRYQHLVVDGVVHHANPSEVEIWARNSEAYVRPERDFLGYTAQPLEQSAREYSAGRCASMAAERELAVGRRRTIEEAGKAHGIGVSAEDSLCSASISAATRAFNNGRSSSTVEFRAECAERRMEEDFRRETGNDWRR